MADLITVEPGRVVSLEVSPSTVTLAVQEVAQFTAIARDEFGNVVLGTPRWAIVGEGGTIDSDGQFTAGTVAGAFADTVVATVQSDTKDVTSRASVAMEPGPLSEVLVDPVETVLDIGATQPFTFMAFDQFGNEISDVLSSWSAPAEVGGIDSNGVLTTGTVAGLFLGAIQLNAVKGAEEVSETTDLTIRPDPLVTIRVEPSPIIVERAATQRFNASGFDQYGNVIPGLAFLWETTGGVITASGRWTAPDAPGRYDVTASATFRGNSASASAAAAIPPAWLPASRTEFGYDRHASVMLADGRVLVVGGTTAELYDPDTGRFSLAGSMLSVRVSGFSATLLKPESTEGHRWTA